MSPERRAPAKSYAAILDAVEDRLRSGQLRIGDRLPSERALAEEFGTPQDYAARFRPDRGRRLRWEAILLTAVAVYWVGKLWAQLADRSAPPDWWAVAGAVIMPLIAWQAWRAWRMRGRPAA